METELINIILNLLFKISFAIERIAILNRFF